jgi:exosortase/archaeosortase family protein
MSNESLIIEYKEKKYSFSTYSLIIYPIGIFVLPWLIILFFELPINFWLHEIIAKQSAFLLNLLFNLGVEVYQNPNLYYPWVIRIPESVSVNMISGCAGIPAMSIFTSIIVFTPHSKDSKTSEDIIWRKSVDIILSIIFIYVFNLIRLVIIIYFYHLGTPWSVIHDSLANLSAVIAVHIFIFLFCNKLIPEWYISVYYAGKLIFNNFNTKQKRISMAS